MICDTRGLSTEAQFITKTALCNDYSVGLACEAINGHTSSRVRRRKRFTLDKGSSVDTIADSSCISLLVLDAKMDAQGIIHAFGRCIGHDQAHKMDALLGVAITP